METFHYIEEGSEEFDVFKPLSERQKYKVQQQLKVQAIINGRDVFLTDIILRACSSTCCYSPGERVDVTKKLHDPSPEKLVALLLPIAFCSVVSSFNCFSAGLSNLVLLHSDVDLIIADTIIPYALLISAVPHKRQGRRSLEDVATVPQNMVEYKAGCGSFYIQPNEFKALANCSQPIGECWIPACTIRCHDRYFLVLK